MAKKKSKVQGPRTRSGRRPAPKRTRESPASAYLDNAIYLGLHLWAILVPLIFSRQTYMQFDLPKVVVIRVLALLLVSLWALKTLLPDRARIRRSPVEVPLALFIVFVSLSTVFSVHLPTSIFGKYGRYEGILTFVSYALIVFVAVQTVNSIERLKGLAWTTVITGSLSSFYGIAQYVGKDPLTWAEVPFEAQRAFSTLGNPDLLAGYLVLAFPLGLALYLSGSREKLAQDIGIGLIAVAGCVLTWFVLAPGGDRFLVGMLMMGIALLWLASRDSAVGGAIGGMMILACLLLSFVRGGWLGGMLALAVLMSLAAWVARSSGDRELALRIAAMVPVVVVGVILLAVKSAGSGNEVLSVGTRFLSIFKVTEGSAGTRLEIWKSAVAMVKASPLVGFGPDTFRLKFAQYQTLGYAQMAGYRTIADNAHNYLLQLASMLGIPGFLSFIAVSVFGLWTGFKLALGRLQVLERPWAALAAAVGAAALAVFGTGLWVATTGRLGLAAAVAVAALALAVAALYGFSRGMNLIPSKLEDPDRVLAIGYLAALAGYIIHLLFGVGIVGSNGIFWLYLGIVAGVHAHRATQVSWRPTSHSMRRLAAGALCAVALLVSVWFTFPYFADVEYVMANGASRQNMLPQAVESYKAAQRLNPYFDRYYSDEGKMYLDIAKQTGQNKDVQKAIDLLKISERNVPLEFDNYMFMADAYMYASRAFGKREYLDMALQQADLALKVKPFSGVASSLRGVILVEQGRVGESIAALKLAYYYHPAFADPHYYLGKIYEQQGQKQQAIAEFRAAVKADSTYTPAQEALNQILGISAPASSAPPPAGAAPPGAAPPPAAVPPGGTAPQP